jgi:hypothetical protein
LRQSYCCGPAAPKQRLRNRSVEQFQTFQKPFPFLSGRTAANETQPPKSSRESYKLACCRFFSSSTVIERCAVLGGRYIIRALGQSWLRECVGCRSTRFAAWRSKSTATLGLRSSQHRARRFFHMGVPLRLPCPSLLVLPLGPDSQGRDSCLESLSC